MGITSKQILDKIIPMMNLNDEEISCRDYLLDCGLTQVYDFYQNNKSYTPIVTNDVQIISKLYDYKCEYFNNFKDSTINGGTLDNLFEFSSDILGYVCKNLNLDDYISERRIDVITEIIKLERYETNNN